MPTRVSNIIYYLICANELSYPESRPSFRWLEFAWVRKSTSPTPPRLKIATQTKRAFVQDIRDHYIDPRSGSSRRQQNRPQVNTCRRGSGPHVSWSPSLLVFAHELYIKKAKQRRGAIQKKEGTNILAQNKFEKHYLVK